MPLPEELREVEGPVILAFGLVRPYKGTDVLLEAFRQIEGAELWVVGAPRMPMEPLHALAARVSGRVRFVERFITEPEIPAFMRRADLVVLPYRNIEQSESSTPRSPSAAARIERRRRLPRDRRARRGEAVSA